MRLNKSIFVSALIIEALILYFFFFHSLVPNNEEKDGPFKKKLHDRAVQQEENVRIKTLVDHEVSLIEMEKKKLKDELNVALKSLDQLKKQQIPKQQQHSDNIVLKISNAGSLVPVHSFLTETAPNAKAVTWVTQFTMDRLYMIELLLERWSGPISACIFSSDIENDVLQVQKHHDRVDFHFVLEYPTPYPVNLLRNVAMVNARTNFLFLADVDFLPSTSSHDYLEHLANYFPGFKGQRAVLVVPAFQMKTADEIPKSKAELINMYHSKKIDMVHNDPGRSKAHSFTDYAKWLTTSTPYKIEYEFPYEPYVMGNKSIPLYDVRFIGYGNDKTEHVYELNVAGYEFWVATEVFIVHKDHPPAKWLGEKDETKQERLARVLKTFFEEVQAKYPEGEPHPPAAPPGFKIVKSNKYEGCDAACGRHQMRCDVAHVVQVNSCRVLRQHFDCNGCTKYLAGPHLPLLDLGSNNICLANPKHDGTQCAVFGGDTQRLCPCMPN